ncbi:MAG: MoaD/ThiS family protein [Candidatus Brockarchaeota archaeon]|nr:MoaD/ThiS family protein [Candidatus Brockarchaeota archaeon]
MRVKVKVFGDLAKSLGKEMVLDLPQGSTVGDLLAKLGKRKEPALDGDSGNGAKQSLVVLVGGLNVRFLDEEMTKLNDGDTVSLLPPAGGG